MDKEKRIDFVIDLLECANSCGEDHLGNKIEWAATIGPCIRQSIGILRGERWIAKDDLEKCMKNLEQ